MIDDDDGPLSEAEKVEREVRQGRKFSASEAMARMAGPGAMKGASPVSPVQQAENEVGNWLARNVADTAGALKNVIHRHLKSSALLASNIERPLSAIAGYCTRVLGSEDLLRDLVRQADAEWGRMMEERPHFDRQGAPAHPDDPYTIENVRRTLEHALGQLGEA